MAGYNYASGHYPMEGKCHPDRLIFGSETFPQDIAKNWEMVKKYDYLIGDFMWTAWDYLGEVGIGAWAYTKDGTGFNKPYPWLLADTGAFDIIGTPNGEMFLAQAAWGLLKAPVIGVQPVNHPGQNPAKMAWRGTNAMASWAWNGCEGNKAIVEVFTDAAVIELLINGKSLGKKKVKNCVAKFKTKYAAGKIEAVAYDVTGREVSRSVLESATGKTHICAAPEAETATVAGIRPDGENRFVINPVPGGTLRYAKASYKSIYGTVESSWERGENGTVFTVTIPANTTARLVMPDGNSRVLDPGTHSHTV